MAYTVIYSCDDCGLVYEIRYSGDEVSYKLSVGETVIFDYVK